MKRVLDGLIAGMTLTFLSPLLLILCLLVLMESPGGALFRQRRVGLHGREFEIFKFRTMRIDNPGLAVTVADDPRITRIGGLMRSTKLDELPQLVNVLRGEMSLVGPRPEVPEYVAWWPRNQRHHILSVRPGITDPASIEFRRESDVLAVAEDPEAYYLNEIMPRKLSLYADYVTNRSAIGDLRIVVHTATATLSG